MKLLLFSHAISHTLYKIKDKLPIIHSVEKNYGSFSKSVWQRRRKRRNQKTGRCPIGSTIMIPFRSVEKPTPLSWAGSQSHPGCRVQQPVGVDDDLRSERCQLDQALPRIVPKNNIDARQLELIIDQEEISSRASYSPCRQQNDIYQLSGMQHLWNVSVTQPIIDAVRIVFRWKVKKGKY